MTVFIPYQLHSGRHFDNIALFRVLSCLGVAAVHFGQRAEFSGPLRRITDFGSNGVYMFFIISGLCCFLSYPHYRSALSYISSRLVRLLPVYYAIILLYMAIYYILFPHILAVPADSTRLGWLKYFLCLGPVITSDNVFWNNLNATWTIAYFLWFYLLTPFLFRIVKSFSKSVVFLAITYAVNLLWGINGFLGPLRGLAFFALGISLYHIRTLKERNIFIGLCLILTVVLFLTGQGEIYPPLFALLLLPSGAFTLRCPAAKRLLRVLDEYSYSIYLGHALVIWGIDFIQANVFPLSRSAMAAFFFAGCILVSWLLHNLIEKPIQHLYRAKASIPSAGR